MERGELRQDVFDTLTNMTRQPGMVGLDLKCEIAANNVAKTRLGEMYEQYGPELLESVANEMIRYTEAILRERIESFGDGEWTEELALEAQDTWRMKVALRKRGDRLVFDFTGTDPQAVKGVNLPFHGTFGFCFAAVLTTLVYDLPKNHGVLRPLEVIAPEGTLVNVKYPGPVSMNTTSCGFSVGFLASSVLMQMLGTHERWKEEIVTPNASHRNGKHSGVNQYGRYCCVQPRPRGHGRQRRPRSRRRHRLRRQLHELSQRGMVRAQFPGALPVPPPRGGFRGSGKVPRRIGGGDRPHPS